MTGIRVLSESRSLDGCVCSGRTGADVRRDVELRDELVQQVALRIDRLYAVLTHISAAEQKHE